MKLFTIVAVSGNQGAYQFVARDDTNEIDVFVRSNETGLGSISIRGKVVDPMTVITRARRAIKDRAAIEDLKGMEF